MGKLKFESELQEFNRNRSKYTGIKPTADSMWCVRGRDTLQRLKQAVIIRDGGNLCQK